MRIVVGRGLFNMLFLIPRVGFRTLGPKSHTFACEPLFSSGSWV